MFAAGKTATVSGGAPDDKFNYVTMLLHGDGTNGAQNNTFVDSSTNNFTITRNGNTTQGSFSPYGSNWSNYFGSDAGNQLSLANSTSLNLSGGAYTIEGWINPLGIYSSGGGLQGYNTIISKRNTSGGNCAWQVYLNASNGYLSFITGTNHSSTTTPTAGVWSHFAAVYDGTNISLYLNGSRVYGPTAMTNTDYNETIFVGSFFTSGAYEQFRGYISNLRVTKGGALYSGSTYTVPTSALTTTVSSGTVSLLTCQGNRFVDASVNAAAISVATGTPSVQRFNPFGTSTAYSTSVIGGSGYFDGSGDYLTGTGSSNLAFGSGDFTIELWVYFNSVASSPAYQFIYSSADSSVYLNTPVIYWFQSSSSLRFNNGSDLISATGIQAKTWYHVAVSRSGTTTKMFLNGVQVGSVTDATTYLNQTSRPMIGANGNGSGSEPFNGYISDVRCVKGTAVYTSAFTPPTAPLTAITNTQLLLNCTNGAIFDNAMINDLETVGNAQISTSVKKFGTGSLSFDGSGDWLIMPYGPTQNFGTGNFTIEGWFYLNSLAASYYVPAGTWGSGTSDEWLIQIQNNGSIRFLTTSGSTFYSASITTATWYHIAVVRNGTTVNIYVNGTSVGSYTCSNSLGSVSKTLYIGSQAGTWDWNGYIDDFRITNGHARYTSNFTAPTSAFSDKGPY